MEFEINTDTWFIFSVLFIGALGLFVLLYVSFPYSIRRSQLNRKAFKIKKKTDHVESLEHKLLEHKINHLQKSNQKLQIDLKNELQHILKSNIAKPDLLQFFSNFEKIYPNFSQSLQKTIPNITANELKLCALIRLNLSSKDISQLLNITAESVNKARYRLRKKWNWELTKICLFHFQTPRKLTLINVSIICPFTFYSFRVSKGFFCFKNKSYENFRNPSTTYLYHPATIYFDKKLFTKENNSPTLSGRDNAFALTC